MGLRQEEFVRDGVVFDPDETYELTTDNVKKILAIYMRFRFVTEIIGVAFV
jgi:hypothetical protein